MQKLRRDEWFFKHEQNEYNRIIRLFFSRVSSQNILKLNSEILFMNCIYKINRYKMSLMMINEVTKINKTFYVDFVFLSSEHTSDFKWICTQLNELYDSLNISHLEVVLTDCEFSLTQILRYILVYIYFSRTLSYRALN